MNNPTIVNNLPKKMPCATLIRDGAMSKEHVTQLDTINNRTAINLFDVNKVRFVRCTGIISGNKITGTVTSTDGWHAYTALGLTTLKKNTCYTLSYKSSRPGDFGGGYTIFGWKDNMIKIIAESLNAINGSVTFNTGSDYDKIQINLVFAVKDQPVIGDTASFWDITLVEGTQPAEYVPYVGDYNTIVDYVQDSLPKAKILPIINEDGIIKETVTAQESPTAFTYTAVGDGVIMLRVKGHFPNGAYRKLIYIKKNGIETDRLDTTDSVGYGYYRTLTTIIPVAAGDVITSSIYQVSGSNARITICYTILPVMVS